MFRNSTVVKPILKWAGGKGQLLKTYTEYLPGKLLNKEEMRYVEPFAGGGAMLFYLLQNYNIKHATMCDVNRDLIDLYEVVKNRSEQLILCVEGFHTKYHSLVGNELRKEYFYEQRNRLNQLKIIDAVKLTRQERIEKSALLILMNKTCFNGLYRVNSKGLFNVPFGRYKNPRILNAENIRAASSLLADVRITCCDFEETREFVDDNTLVYFDPPYRPLSRTSSFTSYSRGSFNDAEQERLAGYFRTLGHETGAKLMLSNSDPESASPDDQFMNRLYNGFHIHKIKAKRAINSKGTGRGAVGEILVTSYEE